MNTESQQQVCPKRWVAYYIQSGIDRIKMKKPGGTKSGITDENREIILSALFNDPHIFGYLRNTWSLQSLANCLTNGLRNPNQFQAHAANNKRFRS